MIAAGRGAIINVGSGSAIGPGRDPYADQKVRGGVMYGATKAALLASEPPEKVNGRVPYSQQVLQEFGWIEKGVGRGVDTVGTGYSQI